MLSERRILEALSREELWAIADEYDLEVADCRKVDDLVEAATRARRVNIRDYLVQLARDRLKELCRALDLPMTGRPSPTSLARSAAPTGTATAGEAAAKAPE